MSLWWYMPAIMLLMGTGYSAFACLIPCVPAFVYDFHTLENLCLHTVLSVELKSLSLVLQISSCFAKSPIVIAPPNLWLQPISQYNNH